jgi:hypothetical protein
MLPQFSSALEKVGGELIIAGDLRGTELPKGVEALEAWEKAGAGRRGWLRNLALSRSRGKIILTGDTGAALGPEDWPRRVLEWAKMIGEEVPYLFGFELKSPSGSRLWDWVSVDKDGKVRLIDYGEQVSGLAVGAGYLGLSRAAWERSGGFAEDRVGVGEEIELSRRCTTEVKIPLVFCDALHGIRLEEPKPSEAPQERRAEWEYSRA